MAALFGDNDAARGALSGLFASAVAALPAQAQTAGAIVSQTAIKSLVNPPKGGAPVSVSAPAAATQPAKGPVAVNLYEFWNNNKVPILIGLAIVVGVIYFKR